MFSNCQSTLAQGLIGVLMLNSVFGCQSTPKVRVSDAEYFLNEELRTWSYPIGEYPKQLVPLLLAFNHGSTSIDAVVTLQFGYHPMRYLVFSEGTVYVNGLYWGRFTYKGKTTYDAAQLRRIIEETESVGDCESWGNKSNLDYLGDLLAYRTQAGTRFCIQASAWGRKDSILGAMLTEFPDRDINWSLPPSSD